MDFIEELRQLCQRAKKLIGEIKTEEATKQAFIVPFIKALGYDVYDPTEVIPEFTADVGTKKGEKVDFAITANKKPIILIECKWSGKCLDRNHTSQLYRYFSVTEARIAILTNGLIYQIFTDLDKPNTMDTKPFLEFDLLNLDESLVPEIKKLSKSSFDLGLIMSSASDLKYTREIKGILAEEIANPSDDFVKFFVAKIHPGRMTQSVVNDFRAITKRSLTQFINDEINTRLKSVMAVSSDMSSTKQPPQTQDILPYVSRNQRDDDKIETTENEVRGFLIVLGILKSTIEPNRVNWKDVETYFSVMLDDNVRRPICRFYFNTAQKYLMVFDHEELRLDN